MPCKIAFVDKLQSFRGNPSALGDRGPAEIVRCAGMKSSIRSFSAVHDPKDQTEERAQQQACHQRKVKCHIIPLNHEVAGQPPQSDPSQIRPQQSNQQDYKAEHDKKARHRWDPNERNFG